MSNSISFVGRIGQDPELKEVGSSTVLEFRVANDTGFGDRKTTNWFRCAYWGSRGAAVQQYLTKGKQVFVTGELTLRKYDKKDGGEGWSHDVNVQALDFVGSRQESQGPTTTTTPDEPGYPEKSQEPSPETTEDLPF